MRSTRTCRTHAQCHTRAHAKACALHAPAAPTRNATLARTLGVRSTRACRTHAQCHTRAHAKACALHKPAAPTRTLKRALTTGQTHAVKRALYNNPDRTH